MTIQGNSNVQNDFYAVVNTGGRQHRISRGSLLFLDLIPNKVAGDEILLKSVSFFFDGEKHHVGTPSLPVCVKAEFIRNIKGKKIHIMKKKKGNRYRKKTGHRQKYSLVRILDVFFN